MSVDTLRRFRESKMKLGEAEGMKRQGELLEEMRADATAVIALASKTLIGTERTKNLEELLDEMQGRIAADAGMTLE